MFQVLFRLNFMTVSLCLCMNRPYQFYYFVPLVSFWFLMVYLVLALPPHVTASSSDGNPLQYLYLVLKFVGLFSVITILYMSEVRFLFNWFNNNIINIIIIIIAGIFWESLCNSTLESIVCYNWWWYTWMVV